MTERDDLDPADWLASQFGEEPPPATVATPPVIPPVAPVAPPAAAVPPVTPPPFAPPPLVAQAPPAAAPPAAPFSFAADAPQASPLPPAAPTPADPLASGFSWSLTPGAATTPVAPEFPAPVEAPSPPAWTTPPAAVAPPTWDAVAPTSPAPPTWDAAPGTPTQAFSFDSPVAGPAEPTPFASPVPPVAPIEPVNPVWPVVAQSVTPPVNSYDMPTQAIAYPGPTDAPTQAFPGQTLSPTWEPEPSAGSWFAAPIDPALDGVTEVLEAELVGSSAPQGEGREASALDDLFGDNQFKDFSDEPFIAPLPPRQAGAASEAGPKPARAPIPRNQKILMWIAGGLVAALALVALFTLGTKLSGAVAPPAALPTPTATETVPPVVATGPVAPGEHRWDELLGGECISPYQSAWQDSYVVVECATPHPAQMVFRGEFDDPASATYPGIDALQKRVPALCGAPTVINYAVAGTAADIQITASFAADESDWDAGNRTFYCFATRAAGATFNSSIAIPQKPATPTPSPTK